MLDIYPVCIEMVPRVRALTDAIAQFDRDQARQLRRSWLSVPLRGLLKICQRHLRS